MRKSRGNAQTFLSFLISRPLTLNFKKLLLIRVALLAPRRIWLCGLHLCLVVSQHSSGPAHFFREQISIVSVSVEVETPCGKHICGNSLTSLIPLFLSHSELGVRLKKKIAYSLNWLLVDRSCGYAEGDTGYFRKAQKRNLMPNFIAKRPSFMFKL